MSGAITEEKHALEGVAVIRFYLLTQPERQGLGMGVSKLLAENTGLARLVIEDARRLLDALEAKIADDKKDEE